jgi:hypothetical protein
MIIPRIAWTVATCIVLALAVTALVHLQAIAPSVVIR